MLAFVDDRVYSPPVADATLLTSEVIMSAKPEQIPETEATADGILHEEARLEIRPALELLSRLRGGNVMDLIAIELNRVVNGVRECSDSKKAGTITLTLKVSKIPKAHRAVSVQAIVVGKAPEDPPDYDLMFFDDYGNLHTKNPEQRDIFDDGPRGT